QRLIWHISFIGFNFNAVEQHLWQPERNSSCRRLQIRHGYSLGLAPVNIITGVIALPKGALLGLGFKLRGFFNFAHKKSSLYGAYREQKLLVLICPWHAR